MSNKPASKAGSKNDDVTSNRRLIQVEYPAAHAGIVAALRRAFEEGAPSSNDNDDQFEALLQRLN